MLTLKIIIQLLLHYHVFYKRDVLKKSELKMFRTQEHLPAICYELKHTRKNVVAAGIGVESYVF